MTKKAGRPKQGTSQIHFRAGIMIQRELEERHVPDEYSLPDLADDTDAIACNINLIAKRDLERYYTVLRSVRKTVHITHKEAHYIWLALEGHTSCDISLVDYIWATVDNFIGPNRDYYEPDITAEEVEDLIEKLKSYTFIQKLAILDRVERAWVHEEPSFELPE